MTEVQEVTGVNHGSVGQWLTAAVLMVGLTGLLVPVFPSISYGIILTAVVEVLLCWIGSLSGGKRKRAAGTDPDPRFSSMRLYVLDGSEMESFVWLMMFWNFSLPEQAGFICTMKCSQQEI